jgi:hypothetical protein
MMDYAAIINLALVTIIYSTFIAPNLKKLSDLRSDISNTEFPIIKTSPVPPDSTAENAIQTKIADIKTKGTSINKKISQYTAVYAETRTFLRIFLITIAVIIAVQVAVNVFKNTMSPETIFYYSLVVAVVILLYITLRVSMIRPPKIRTMTWLYSVGISEAYSKLIYDPVLWGNYHYINSENSRSDANLAIASKATFYGNRVIATVESDDGTYLYKVVAGVLNPRAREASSHSNSGEWTTVIDLFFDLKLRPAQYKIRFLYFGSVFGGLNQPYEIVAPFTVTKLGYQTITEGMDLSEESSNFDYHANKKGNPVKIDFESNNENVSVAMRTLLESKKFQKMFSKTARLFEMDDTHAGLSTIEIEKRSKRIRYVISFIKLFFIVKFSKKEERCKNVRL